MSRGRAEGGPGARPVPVRPVPSTPGRGHHGGRTSRVVRACGGEGARRPGTPPRSVHRHVRSPEGRGDGGTTRARIWGPHAWGAKGERGAQATVRPLCPGAGVWGGSFPKPGRSAGRVDTPPPGRSQFVIEKKRGGKKVFLK